MATQWIFATKSIVFKINTEKICLHRKFVLIILCYFLNAGCKDGEYDCGNKKCIKLNQMCDENDDCGNGSDEKWCGRSIRSFVFYT